MKQQQNQRIRYVLSGLILLVLFLNLLFTNYPLAEAQPLKGYTKPSVPVTLSAESWLDGSYQKYKEQAIADSSYMLPFLIRLHNEIEFYAFSKVHVQSIIQGQSGYLFDREDIAAYCGSDQVGTVFIEDQVRKLKFIEQQLKPYGKSIVVVLVPGKSSLLPEYLPANIPGPGRLTNLSQYVRQLETERVPFINFAAYFKRLKRSSSYPLFGKYAVHWSNYASTIASDSIIRYMEHLYGIDMTNCTWKTVKTQAAHGTDIDFLEALNLLHYPNLPKMGYPDYQYDLSEKQAKPPFLAIGDSYYWGLPEFQTPFSDYHFWFYNNEVYPETSVSSLFTYQLNLKAELAKHDIILFFASEANLKDLGWGAIDRIAQELKNPETIRFLHDDYTKKTQKIIQSIRGVPQWLQAITQKAAEKHISVDSMLTLDARWVYHQYEQKK